MTHMANKNTTRVKLIGVKLITAVNESAEKARPVKMGNKADFSCGQHFSRHLKGLLLPRHLSGYLASLCTGSRKRSEAIVKVYD